MGLKRRQQAAASAAFIAIAATALIGGTFAQFTDKDETEQQTIEAGRLTLVIHEGPDWNTSDLILAPDDTIERSLTATNEGNIPIKAIELTAHVADSAGIDPSATLSEAVTVTVRKGEVVVAGPVLLSDFKAYPVPMGPKGLESGESLPLTLTYKFVATPDETGQYQDGDYTAGDANDFATNPDNRYQGASMDVEYVLEGVQRDALSQ